MRFALLLSLAAAAATGASSPSDYFPDSTLIDQNGRHLRFYSDLVKGKVVLINSFFSCCAGVCPMMNTKLQRIQEAFSDRIGKDFVILSISVDPDNDNVKTLAGYARRNHARPGWYFLTGSKDNLRAVQAKLGQYVEKREDHSTVFLIGNEPKRFWRKALSMLEGDRLVQLVDEVLNRP